MITFSCTIDYVVFQSPETGYTVLKAVPESGKGYITLVLRIIEPTPGLTLRVTGDWENNTKFGKQFSVVEWEEELPNSIYGIERYLSSGLIKGIGPVLSKRIVKQFGVDTFDVLSNFPERLTEVNGLGKKKCETIITEWKKQEDIREIMIFLKKFDISTRIIVRIYKKFGNEAINIIKDNPYSLIDSIDGIGFRLADSIALSLGFTMDSPLRCKSGVVYALKEMCEDGDTYEPIELITKNASDLLEVDDETTISAINELIDESVLIDEDGKIFLSQLHYAEENIATKLVELSKTYSPTNSVDINAQNMYERTGFEYAEEQLTAIRLAMKSNILVLTGGPGTGKTATIKGIIEVLSSLNMRIGLAAPTGKAAKRMTELTGREAMTIHRFLGYRPDIGYEYNAQNPVQRDAVIIDESSMINTYLMNNLISAISRTTKFILVGDIDQLPCIGPGNILKDIIASNKVPVVQLTKIFRQSETSNIILNSHRVRDGKNILIDNSKKSNFFFLNEKENMVGEIAHMVSKRLPAAYNVSPDDIQVITPMKKCAVGTINLNSALQQALNPYGKEIKRGNSLFKVGDRVVQTVNDYDKDVFNGDCGIIYSVDEEEKTVVIRFDDRDITYTFNELEDVMLSYALTIHKSQGSEYKIVVIPITYANKIMMQRNLIYTAITRARDVCIIIGPRNLVEYGIRNVEMYQRKTSLCDRLIKKFGSLK